MLMKRPAVFLDRDGTLIEEVNYLSSIADLRVYPFATEALQLLKKEGFRVVVVTNQSGIGRGIFPESAMHQIHRRIEFELPGLIERFYFCPHIPEDGCDCRKPGTGMIDKAHEDLSIEMTGSWMIGDKDLDIETGKNAGVATILVRTGYGGNFNSDSAVHPDHVEDDHLDAAKRVVREAVMLDTN